MTKATKPPVDKQAVERDYRTGAFTDRELGAKYGVSHTSIQKWAKKEGWEKDLQGAVKAATAAKLIQFEVAKGSSEAVAKAVAKSVASAIPATSAVVAAVAEVNSAVILRHRGDILSTRNLAMEMLGELAAGTHSANDLAALLRMASTGVDPDDIAALQQSMKDLMRLHNRVGSIQKLAETLSKLQAMERKAFALDEEEGNDPSKGKELSDVERAARVQAFIERARKAKAAAGQ